MSLLAYLGPGSKAGARSRNKAGRGGLLGGPLGSALVFLLGNLLFWTALLCSLPVDAHAQGCSACRDATAGSAPQVRAGLRRAIVALVVPAGGIFVAVLVIARKIEEQRESEDRAS